MKRDICRSASPLLAYLVLSFLPACQQKMAVQPSFKPLSPSSFFDNGQSARPEVPGTVARGHLHSDLALFSGKRSGETQNLTRPAATVGTAATGVMGAMVSAAAEPSDYVDTFPLPVTREFVQHGHDRFMIYCVVCHDAIGTGAGKIVERGYTRPPSFHITRLREAPVGHFFDVITNGYGSMPSYREQVPPRDRWAIVAYVRALQLSQHFPVKELSGRMREEWKKASPDQLRGGEPR
jgi:mono/diheme cytochrome c family protein